MSGIHGVHVADERDPWLLLGLGLRSTLTRFDALLATYAPETPARTVDGDVDDGTAFVLGVIAIAERLARRLDATASPLRDPDLEQEPAEWFR